MRPLSPTATSAGEWPNALKPNIPFPVLITPPISLTHTPKKVRRRRSLASSPTKSRIFEPITPPNLVQLPIPPEQCILSTRMLQNVSHAIQHSWASSTLTNYGQAVDRYMHFCKQESIPVNMRFPANEFVLCAFAAENAGILAGTTVRNHIAGLRAWHIAQNVEWKGGIRLQYVLTGIENLAPESAKRKPRPPITLEMLQLLYRHLNLLDPFDAAVFACATVAFWAQCRLGELLPTNSTTDSHDHLPTRHHLRPARANSHALRLHIPRTKTHPNGEDVNIVSQLHPINPLTALDNHMLVNSNIDPSLPLFAFTSPNGPRSLTRAKFLERCNMIWTAHGYPRSTGHSFRIGGTTQLLLAGVAPDVVRVMGRWSSDAFHRYWRSADSLAVLHAADIPPLPSPKRRRLA